MFDVVIIIILGIIAGSFTGLIPGIHVNLVAIIILLNISYLNQYLEINLIILFIISMGVTHTFISFIPSVIFGVPSEETFLSTLPAHKLLLEGRGYYATFLSALGSFLGIVFSIIISPLFYFIVSNYYFYLKSITPYFLIFVILFLIYLEPTFFNKLLGLFIVLTSGALGLLILNSKILVEPLLVLFSSFFGIASIIISLNESMSKIPKQEYDFKFNFNFNHIKQMIVATFSSSICSFSPGIGSSQAATISTIFIKDNNSENFIIISSSINTINFILSLITLYLIQKSRNGAVLVISQIQLEFKFIDLLYYFLLIFFIGILLFKLTLILSKKILKIVEIINFNYINYTILTVLFILIFYISGIYGVFIAIISTSLGILTVNLNIKRVHLMSVLLIPVIFNII